MAKIFRSGNSKVVTIPEAALRKLGLSVGDEVEVEVEESEIHVSPLKKKFKVDPEIHRLTQKFIKNYRPALEKLAKA